MSEMVFRLDVHNRPLLLFAAMRSIAPEGGFVSFEGNLANTELLGFEGAIWEETATLKRATLQPRLDFVVIPLGVETVERIVSAIESKISFAGYKGIIHVQIETNGRIAFAAYDNFGEDCVVARPPISSKFLDHLVKARILRSYIQSI